MGRRVPGAWTALFRIVHGGNEAELSDLGVVCVYLHCRGSDRQVVGSKDRRSCFHIVSGIKCGGISIEAWLSA